MNFSISYKNLFADTAIYQTMKKIVCVIVALALPCLPLRHTNFELNLEGDNKAAVCVVEQGIHNELKNFDLEVSESDQTLMMEPVAENNLFDHTEPLNTSAGEVERIAVPPITSEADKMEEEIKSDFAVDVPVPPVKDSISDQMYADEDQIHPSVDNTVSESEAIPVPDQSDEIPRTEEPAKPLTYMTSSGFEYDENGMIISCAGASCFDGLLVLPSDAACTGISALALSEVGGDIYEIYIPANITYIEPGALNSFVNLCYVEVHPDNPSYTSLEGELYYLDGTKF